MNQQKPVTISIIGAGKRGEAYANYARLHPDRLRVVAVAEPREIQLTRLAERYGIPSENCFRSYAEFAAATRLSDAVAICTQDRMHLDAVESIAPKGYAILLEKPMSPELAECERIVATVKKHGNLLTVCHVLLYTNLTAKLRGLLDQGVVGEIVSIQHMEPVAWWHQAHSFVRGNWRNETESSFMLMAKSCHDIDWMRHIVGKRCKRVASFGSLRHFKASDKPEGATDRCWECPAHIESNCPYSAKRLYYTNFERDGTANYINDIITEGRNTREAVEEALRHGPYGRCVYSCDNDVVDNQVVILEYEGPVTATFTMTAFTPALHRATRIFGTRGFIETDFVKIKLFDFTTEKETIYDTSTDPVSATAESGHGGGNYHIMRAFVDAVMTGDTSGIHSGWEASMESHRVVFAAEKARRSGRVVELC